MPVIEQVVTFLEMTDPGQLRPSPEVADLSVHRAEDPAGRDAARIRRLHDAVATPHHWSSLARSEEQWREILGGWSRSHWIAAVRGRDAGWASLEVDGPGSVQIAAFGLRPEAVGLGYGGPFLTEVVRRAWQQLADTRLPCGEEARVWLSTSSWDHPHALTNYVRRGFRVTFRELRRRESGGRDRWSVRIAEPPETIVRPAVAVDDDGVAVLLEELGHPLPVDVVRRRLGRLARGPDDVVAVAAAEPDRLVGVVSAHVVPMLAEPEPGFVRITSLSVSPSATRKGVGRRLVDFVEAVASDRGLTLLEVSSGRRPEREAAHRFYPALGFEDSSRSSVRYWKRLGPERG